MRRNKRIVTLLLIVIMSMMFGSEALAASGNQDWRWPVPESDKMSSCYLDGRNHYAIDVQADNGMEVYASYYGEVVSTYVTCGHNYCKYYSCGCGGGLGNYVYIRHIYNGKSYVSRYGHLAEVFVSVGDVVTEETLIGTVGSTGYSTGFHLDYRVYEGYTEYDDRRENVIDPLMEQFVELPEGFHANATTWCCYSYEADVLEQYANHPKVVETERAMSYHPENCDKYYLCENSKLQMDVAVFGDLWVRLALSRQ